MADLGYNYTLISNNSTPPDFSSFPLVPNLYANPSINNEGYVSFEGLVGTPTNYVPPSAIYSGNGSSPPTTLVDTTKYQFTDNTGASYNSGIFYSPTINDSGTTVFAGAGYNFGAEQATASGPTAVLTSTNGSINNVVYQSTPFVTVAIDPNVSINDPANTLGTGSFASAPGLNNAGTVAYVAGNADGTTGIYTKNINSGVTGTIADSSGNLKDFLTGGLDVGRGTGQFSKYTLPSINNNGEVAFNADLKTGGRGIFVGKDGNLTTIADSNNGFTYFSVPSLNDSKTVAFNAGLANGGSGIFLSKDGKLTTIADTNGIFKGFRSDVALNEAGQVAFLADLKDGTTAIYTGSDLGLNKVIGVGDPLDGSTVSQLFISHNGLNDVGQLSFDAILTNGFSQEVFRADLTPVPEPSSIPLLGVAILGMVGYHWRRRKQSAKHASQKQALLTKE